MKFYNINNETIPHSVDKSVLEPYINDYISFGKRMGYFNNEQAEEFRNKLLNIGFEIDNNANGNACVEDNNKLIINADRVFGKTEEFACSVLYHEFTHLCNNINHDMYNVKGRRLIEKLSNNASSYMNTDYQHLFERTKKGETNNPYTYIFHGGKLIDEIVANQVSTEMVKMKFNKPILFENRQKQYGDFKVSYRTRFDYYGIGESIVDEFSRTLFLKNNCKNLDGLARETFKKNFVYELIQQHCETRTAFKDLVEELGHMGVIAFTEEQSEGRYKKYESISPHLIRNSYSRLQELFREGREEREKMPENIPVPSFME